MVIFDKTFYKKQINILKAFFFRALDFIPSVLTGMFVLVI